MQAWYVRLTKRATLFPQHIEGSLDGIRGWALLSVNALDALRNYGEASFPVCLGSSFTHLYVVIRSLTRSLLCCLTCTLHSLLYVGKDPVLGRVPSTHPPKLPFVIPGGMKKHRCVHFPYSWLDSQSPRCTWSWIFLPDGVHLQLLSHNSTLWLSETSISSSAITPVQASPSSMPADADLCTQ